ncbi:MAG TPA: hypothetical protein VGK17_09200 [Propionicimonas sp.]|jgi:hypothetical protein
MNRPKAIGTAAETAVVRAARRLGFPNAERRALRGRHDVGDILLCPGVVLEVKGGQAARSASDGQVSAWLAETERERVNAHAAAAVLVTQRAGVGEPNAERWTAHLRLGQMAGLCGWPLSGPVDTAPLRLSLADALSVLRSAGYGEPLPGDAHTCDGGWLDRDAAIACPIHKPHLTHVSRKD